MANNTHKEQWIDQVMSCASGMSRALPPSYLVGKIMTAVNAPVIKAQLVAIPVRRWAAAAIILLMMNIGSVIYFTGRSRNVVLDNTENTMFSEFQTESTYNY